MSSLQPAVPIQSEATEISPGELTVDARPGNITPFTLPIINAGALNISLRTSFMRTHDEMIAFDLGCLPAYLQVELAGRVGSCVRKISRICRKCEWDSR
jgi:hypothetical protein